MSSTEAETVVATEENQVEAKEESPATAQENGTAEVAPEAPKDATEAPKEAAEDAPKELEEVKQNGSSAAPESDAAASEENPAPECDAEAPKEEAPAEVSEVDELFTKLSEQPSEGHVSLLKKHLTKALLDKVKGKKTSQGSSLADCIRSGAENPESKVGLYAPDPDAYKTFSDLFDPIIKDYHRITGKKIAHPNASFGDLEKLALEDLDPEGKYVLSTRIRVARAVEGFNFPPTLSAESRKELETKIVEVVTGLEEELKGSYQALNEMDDDTKAKLIEEHFLFKEGNKFHASFGDLDWPNGRGIFLNENKTFMVWVNEGDHIRIISMQKGGNIAEVYKRLVNGIKKMEEKLKFARDNRLGFLAFCPTNIGTGLRASVHIQIPTLAASDKFQETCDKFNLQPRGINGEHTESVDGVYDISIKRRLGLTEIQAITEMYNGVKELIRLEKELTWRPENVEDMFDHLNNAKTCKSLLKKHLTKEIFDSLKDKKTSRNGTLGDCIMSGVLNLDSGTGIYAADQESYTEFAALFDPVIKDYHKLKPSDAIAQPAMDFGDLDNLDIGDLDPEGEMIVSTRIRVGRSHQDIGFPPVLANEDRLAAEKKTVEALNCLEGELKGTYHPLTGMTDEVKEQMRADHFLFNDSDRFLREAGGYKDWPEGRGIFFSENKNFLVWVNEEDHLRIISMQKGGDLGAVYKRLVTGIKSMEEKLTFARDERLGYLTFCPTNLGTTLRASVHIKIPLLSARKDFKAIMEKNKLQARGIHGEHTASEGGVYDISNKRRLGLSEIEAVKEMDAGVKEVIRLEKDLAAGKTKSCSVL